MAWAVGEIPEKLFVGWENVPECLDNGVTIVPERRDHRCTIARTKRWKALGAIGRAGALATNATDALPVGRQVLQVAAGRKTQKSHDPVQGLPAKRK